jgi:hypothetical protein
MNDIKLVAPRFHGESDDDAIMLHLDFYAVYRSGEETFCDWLLHSLKNSPDIPACKTASV